MFVQGGLTPRLCNVSGPVGLVSWKERKRGNGAFSSGSRRRSKKEEVLREAKTSPPNGVVTRIATRFRRKALGSLVTAKASRLRKFQSNAPGPKHTSKKVDYRI